MRLEVLNPPATEIVTLSEAKRFARMYLDLTDDDDLVSSLIRSARELVESRTARCFLATTLKETRVVPASGRLRLSRHPVKQLVSLSVDGEPVDPLPDLLTPADLVLKAGSTVEITYIAGVDDVDDVPEVAKTIVKMLASHWYGKRTPTNRDAQNAVPLHVDALCDSLRWGGSIPR